MRARSRAMVVAAFTSVALLATACGGGDSTEEPQASTGQGGGEITINGCTPENPLIPGGTSEVCGGNVLDAFVSKLVHYNVDTAEPEMDIAESIETEDNQNFTVTLKQGYKFHDGTEVKAKNFVDAWNFTAAAENAQAGSYFFTPIEGFDDVQCGDDGDCDANPAEADSMSGLAVVDDYTFTITTTEKVSNLPVRLGYSAFAPLPDSFFDDQEGYEAKPIGAGPFQVESISSTEMVLTKFADYSGDYPATVDKVTYRIYQDISAAYADVVAGNLDILDQVPPDNLIGDAYLSDLPDRTAQREAGSIRYITFSPADEQLADNPDLRKAISMSIDRAAIAQTVLSNSEVPATGWVSPVVDGYQPNACGEACVFDAAKAKALYEQAGGYEGTLTYTANTDGAGNQQIGEAICNQISNNLGLDCQFNGVVDFATFNNGIDSDEYTGMFRSGWQMDYPSIENFLAPIYQEGADSNWSDYASPRFNELLAQAAAADESEANSLYQQAEAELGKDFPTAPLTYRKTTVAWSDRVSNVKINPFGVPDVAGVQVTG
ncbi:ABC transporter substrate-binding protein [Auraticoccus sp. F435]|uniref:ABC transporter substrate-binding protein n=1 Tax=Auraticoccus cholistanensis TaxID=2656650 RepID=A0A6A9UX43_9ACTN|nr:ABC transporter substrate-binding protein [Auraticoccus cholistanensis]MVA76225.1 ABC transporter substrate-binding protein [Auraticoccus cholistanensis]